MQNKADLLSSLRTFGSRLVRKSVGRIASVESAPHLLLLILFSVFALAPLAAPGYFIYGHDARHSVYFLQMFDMSMRDGAWYPRWATDMVFGYGYPLWLILAPIPFFAGEAFHLLGFDFVSAVKIVDGLAFLLSSVGMYLFVKDIFGRNAGLLAAIAYAYVPYHLVDLYVRSAQAELVAFVFPPFVFWAFHRLALTHNLRYLALAGFAYAGLLLSHIQSAAFFTPIIGLYLIFLTLNAPRLFDGGSRAAASRSGIFGSLFSKERLRFMFLAGCSIALALGIAAMFVLPVAAEFKYLTTEPLIGGSFNFRDHFLNASQLLSPFWGYGYGDNGTNGTNEFSLQLGLIPVLLSFISLLSLNKMPTSARGHLLFFWVILVLIVFAVLPLSRPLWEIFSGIGAFVQFPWRLLSITTFALAVLCGAVLYSFASEQTSILGTLAIALLFVVGGYAYTEPQHTEAVFNYQTQMDFEVNDGELLGDTVWMTGPRPTDSPLVPQYQSGATLEKAVALDDGASVKMVEHGGQSDTVQVDSSAPSRIMFYTRYFPGWVAKIDGHATALEPFGEQGLILVNVPPGSHIVSLRFEDTPVRQIGTVISLASLLVALGLMWKSRSITSLST